MNANLPRRPVAGRMDHAHHANNARRALDEVLALEDAVLASRQLTRQAETLTVVTADHSHVFTIGGTPPRGNPVFGEMVVVQRAARVRDTAVVVCLRRQRLGDRFATLLGI